MDVIHRSVFSKLMGITLCLLFFSCGNKEEKQPKQSTSISADTLSVVKEKRKSLTLKEAEALVKAYIKANAKKYSSLGKVMNYETVGGDYDGDNFTDYLSIASFNAGESEYNDPVYFFYDSSNDKLSELTLSNNSSPINWLTVDKISKDQLSCTAWVTHDFVGEKKFKCTLTVDRNKLIIPKKAVKKAEQLLDEMMLEHELNSMDPSGDPESFE